MARIHRRKFLKFSGAGAIMASAGGGLAGILASGRAPAYAQATSVHYLRWSDFVPASDKLLKEKIAPQCEKELGIKLNIEMVNANDLQARITWRFSRAQVPTSSMRSATGRSCMPRAWRTSATWPKRS